jgi:hypothetical protein
MQTASHHACLPRVIAVYIVVYAVVTQMPSWHDWWYEIFSSGTPGPSALTEAAALTQKIILWLWLPLSFFVWRRYMWSRWLVAYSALVLGFAQCALYSRILSSYGSISLMSEALVLAVPTFFFSALVFCPLVGQAFSHAQDNDTPSI